MNRGRNPLSKADVAWAGLGVPILAFLFLPIALLAVSTDPGRALSRLAEPAALEAIRISAVTSTATVLLALVFGAPLAYLLAKRQFPGRRVLDALIDLPVVLPPAVAGIALLLAFGRRGPMASWLGWEISFSMAAVIMAQLFVSAPLFVRTFSAVLRHVDRDLEEAAALDGASPIEIARRVSFPIARGGLFSGMALCWARAVGEFGATLLFAGNFPGRTQTVPLAIYLGFEADFETAVALSALLLAASTLVLVSVRFLQSR